jgi:hypothetical protein
VNASGDSDLKRRAGAVEPDQIRDRFLEALARDDKEALLSRSKSSTIRRKGRRQLGSRSPFRSPKLS